MKINQLKNLIMDTPVPAIDEPALVPSPFRRGVHKLQDLAKKAANKVNTKLNEFYDWLIDYVPQSVRVDPTSAIEKLKEHVKKLYTRAPDFTPVEKSKGAKGYFKTYTITGQGNYDPRSFLRAVEQNVVRLIESNLNRGIKVKLVLRCDMEKRNPATDETIIQSPHFRSKLKVIIENNIISEEYREMTEEILENIAKYQREGSNWNFKRIISMDIHLNKYERLFIYSTA